MGVPLKILIVGLGGIGQRHARNLRTLMGQNVKLLAYRLRRNTQMLTDKMQVENGIDVESGLNIQVFTTLEDALAENPSAVIIANPTSMHLSVARAAAEAGCHLFVEKPISHTLEGVEELLGIIKEKKLVTLVGYQWRFHPMLEHIKNMLERETIGKVISVMAEFGEYLPHWHPYEDYRQSYAARHELGGGVLLTQIHDFDYLGWLFGWPKRVFCSGGKLSSLEIDVEDTANTMLECEIDGRQVPIHVHQDYVQTPHVRGFKVIGDEGRIEVDLANSTFTLFNKGQEVDTPRFDTIDRNQIFLAEMNHFLACIEGNAVSRLTAEESVNSLRVALAARESLRTGTIVNL